MSPDAMMKSYNQPNTDKHLSEPVIPSMTISMLPNRMTQNPQNTKAWSNPMTGLLKIFDCIKATSIITHKRLPKSFIGYGLVSLKNEMMRLIVYANTAMVSNNVKLKIICLVMYLKFILVVTILQRQN